MKLHRFPICVLGSGHLAAATRVQLRLRGLAGGQEQRAWHSPLLFVACSDFENATLCPALAHHAREDGASLLFACITGELVRVGPLITPCASTPGDSQTLFAGTAVQVDFSRETLTPFPDTRFRQVAQIGARVVVGELAKLYIATRGRIDSGLLDFDSPSEAGEMDYRAQTDAGPSRYGRHARVLTSSCHRWTPVSHLWHPSRP